MQNTGSNQCNPLDVVSRGDKMNRKHVVSVGGVGLSALSPSSAVPLHSELYTHEIHPRSVSLSIHKAEQSPGRVDLSLRRPVIRQLRHYKPRTHLDLTEKDTKICFCLTLRQASYSVFPSHKYS